MTDEDWGAQQERRRRRSRWAIVAALTVFSGLAAVLLPFVGYGHGVFGAQPPRFGQAAPGWLRVGTGLVLVAAALVAARLNWNRMDEFRRESLIRFWAAFGYAVLVMFPVLYILGPYVSAEKKLALVYGVGLGASLLHYLYRLRRHGWTGF